MKNIFKMIFIIIKYYHRMFEDKSEILAFPNLYWIIDICMLF